MHINIILTLNYYWTQQYKVAIALTAILNFNIGMHLRLKLLYNAFIVNFIQENVLMYPVLRPVDLKSF